MVLTSIPFLVLASIITSISNTLFLLNLDFVFILDWIRFDFLSFLNLFLLLESGNVLDVLPLFLFGNHGDPVEDGFEEFMFDSVLPDIHVFVNPEYFS